MSLALQSNFLQTTENNTQRFDRSSMRTKPNELPAFVGRTFTAGELHQYVDDKVRANKAGAGSFSETLKNAAGHGQGIKVYMKTDDMLYSGGNGTGLSYYLKYAEESTDEEPVVLAKGVDENGEEFEQKIHIKDVNPRNGTIIEMRALEAYIDAPKAGRLSSLPNGCENVGLHERQDFLSAFRSEIADMRTLGEYGLMSFLENNLRLYEKFGAGFYDTNDQTENKELYGRSRVDALVKRHGEDSPYAKALRGLEKSFDATFPNAPDESKDAWIDMSIDSGTNEITGISLDGSIATYHRFLRKR